MKHRHFFPPFLFHPSPWTWEEPTTSSRLSFWGPTKRQHPESSCLLSHACATHTHPLLRLHTRDPTPLLTVILSEKGKEKSPFGLDQRRLFQDSTYPREREASRVTARPAGGSTVPAFWLHPSCTTWSPAQALKMPAEKEYLNF